MLKTTIMNNMALVNFTDLSEYELPQEDMFGQCRATNEFAKEELLGQGSFSKIYKANDTRNERTVIMKHILGTKTNIMREINILSELQHSNIVTLYDIAVEPALSNDVCLIMEYCALSLDKFIDDYPEERIPENQIKGVMKQICEGLNYLHTNHVAHRDIKPPNILLNSDGIIKIIDFGQSRQCCEPSRPMTPDVSTVWYRSPEILFGAPSYSYAIDMWALGCIFGELFERQAIFQGSSQLEQISLIIDLIGSPNISVWPGFKKTTYFNRFNSPNQPYNAVNERFKGMSEQGLNLIVSLLIYDPERRASSAECLIHRWFRQAPMPAASILLPDKLKVANGTGNHAA